MSKNNVKKVSLQFELLNTYYQNSACNLSYTPKFIPENFIFTQRHRGTEIILEHERHGKNEKEHLTVLVGFQEN
jgi:hypothetical protein